MEVFVRKNSLVHVNRLAARRQKNRVDELYIEMQPAVQLTAEVLPDALTAVIIEAVAGNNSQNRPARSVLVELELADVGEGVVVHVHGRPGDLRPIGGNEYLLRPVTPNVTDDRVIAAAGLAAIADVGCEVARSITDERHNGVDEAGADDFTAMPRRRYRPALLVQQLEVAISRPDMVICGMLALSREDELLGVAVAGEVPTTKDVLH